MTSFRFLPILILLFLSLDIQEVSAQIPIQPGIQYYENGELDQAKSFFEDYLDSNKKSAEANYWMGRIIFDENDFNDASDYFEKAAELDEGNAHYHMWLGHSYGRWTQEASRLRQPFLAGKSRSNYEKAVELAPENIEARESLIEFYIQAPGFLGGGRDKAEDQASAIMDLNKEAGYLAWGRIFTYFDEIDAARMNYSEAIEHHPELMGPYYRLYTFYFNEGEFGKAAEITARQLSYNDTTSIIYLYHGNALQRNDQFKGAFESYQKSLQLDSTQYNAWYQIGRLAAVSGEYLTEGFEYIDKFIKLEQINDATKAWAHFRKGTIHEHLNNDKGAVSEYEKALQFDPDHNESKAALSRLK
jgi:tetratricopeptide (TPR) repeat protein